jgi:SET family sugar efflux transporter-like MFS transporter
MSYSPIKRVYALFLLVALLVGTAGALQSPTLSLFLTNEVHARPMSVGLFYTLNAIAGIVVSFLLAYRSDKHGERRNLLIFCCLMAIANCIVFATSRNYFFLLFVGIFLSAIANAVLPQLFALAREYADGVSSEVVMFSSMMRAMLSLAWVIGPPLSFWLAMHYSFTIMYLCSAVVFACGILIIWRGLPDKSALSVAVGPSQEQGSAWRDEDVRLLFIFSVLMWVCNISYAIDMPLYITQDLHFSEQLAGGLLGGAAAIEIPAMLLAGYAVKRCGKRRLMRLSTCCGVIFYIGMALFHSEIALMVLQLFNAIFIGVVGGLGLLYFQELMPGRAGAATTMFTNSISTGVIFAGLLQGAVVEHFGHLMIYPVIAVLALVALGLMYKIKEA